MKDVLGQAIADYYHMTSSAKLWVHSQYGPKELMPVETYFRNADNMPDLEWIALQHCRGRILDIGAGAGSHTLFLQQTGLHATALEISPRAAGVIEARGVKHIRNQDFFTIDARKKYDTLLLLMNGIGLAGTIDGLRTFLKKARTLLRPGGRLVFDSCDVAYLYNDQPPKGSPYYGEVLYQYEYRRMRSDWFHWLFIDRLTFGRIAAKEGWNVTLLYKDKFGHYLVECTPGTAPAS